jgi:zinc D-Ala-D-Ala dipeptidase
VLKLLIHKLGWVRLLFLLNLAYLGPAIAVADVDARHPLADLSSVPGLRIECAYGSRQNCVRQPIYPPDARAWADRRVATALGYAERFLEQEGYRLVILDAYRPPWAVEQLWKIGKDMKLDVRYLSNPAGRGSDHSRGAAVDVTMEAFDGRKLELPCRFDTFGQEAWIDYHGATPRAAAHRDALCAAMEAAGFRVHPEEWWHYVLPEAKTNPIYRIDLATGESLSRGSQQARR